MTDEEMGEEEQNAFLEYVKNAGPTDMVGPDGRPLNARLTAIGDGNQSITVHWAVWSNVSSLLIESDDLPADVGLALACGNSTGQSIGDAALCESLARFVRDRLKDFADDDIVYLDNQGDLHLGKSCDTWEETSAHAAEQFAEDEMVITIEPVEVGPVRTVLDFIERSGGFTVKFA